MVTSHGVGGRPHALVVGGTGMLRGLTLSLAGQGYTVSSHPRETYTAFNHSQRQPANTPAESTRFP